MEKAFQQLWDFHEAFNLSRSTTPHIPEQKVRDLRMRLVREEMQELEEAEADNDLVEIADALADIIYVCIGHAVSYGIPMDKVWEEVHKSNMSKLDDNGKPIYNEFGKVQKSKNFKAPDIASILNDTP